MSINYNNNIFGCERSRCFDEFGCGDQIPDFIIRQHDTRPELKVKLEDCEGPMDIRGLVVEVNMWAVAKLRKNISDTDDYFCLADNIGFQQIMINDIIIMDRVRLPEYMLVTGFDEDDKIVRVQRGYKGSTPSNWKKGTKMRIFRVLNSHAETEIVYEDIRDVDGTIRKDTITSASLIYKWQPEDTCLPGCFWLEFKILKMIDLVLYLPGGHWIGPVYRHDDGHYYTGTAKTESSVKLSYDSVNDRYLLPIDHWTGDYHVFSANYYTGTEHNDGSVYLDRNDRPFGSENAQQPVGIPASSYTTPSKVDVPPLPPRPPFYPSPFGGGLPYYDQLGPHGEPLLARPYDETVPVFERVPYENPFTEPFYLGGAIFGDFDTLDDEERRRKYGNIQSDDEIVQSLQYNECSNVPSFVPPSFTPPSAFNPPSTFNPATYGCWLGLDVEWTRRMPTDGQGYLIKIVESPTKEF
jgi:hypothetical protein